MQSIMSEDCPFFRLILESRNVFKIYFSVLCAVVIFLCNVISSNGLNMLDFETYSKCNQNTIIIINVACRFRVYLA